jgi:hypothetical protein
MRIAFGYKAGSGKSTAVKYLIEKYGGIEKSFAEPLYKILHYAQDVCHFEKTKDRQFLQYIGTEWARKKNDSVWINLLLESILFENGNIFISDLRFRNEFNVIDKKGFVTVLIIRDASQQLNHESENSLDGDDVKWNYIIRNNGTLEEFYEKLDRLVAIINKNDII